jgi:serine/threonine-protein kinase HipA
MLIIIRRALFAWLIADGDMHLKNLALLKVAQPGARTFETVRMAPLYDAVTTQVFPTLEHDRMALKLNGKDNRLRRSDFIKAAATAGLSAGDTNKAIDDLLGKFEKGLGVASLPDMAGIDDGLKASAEKMLGICAERLTRFSNFDPQQGDYSRVV